VHKLHVGPLIAKMKLATIVGVLAALAVANAGSVDIKLQGKAIAITPTEDAWQQLVAPLSEASQAKCCTTCTAPKNKYFSIAHDSGKWLCGETCIRDSFFPIFHIFEKNLTKAASRTATVCADAGYNLYDSTVTHGGGGLYCTLDLYACSKGEGNCEHPPAASMNETPSPVQQVQKLPVKKTLDVLAKLVNVTDQCDKECRAACCKDGGGCENNSYLRATCDAKCGCPPPLPPDTYKCGTGKVVAEVVTHNYDLNKVEMDYCYPRLQGPGKSICKTCTILYQASSTDPYYGPYITTLQIAEEVDQLLYWDVTDSSRTKTVSRALAPWPTRLDVEFDDASDSYKCINKQCVKAPGGITKESCLRICG